MVELQVLEPVKIKFFVDGQKPVTDILEAKTHLFRFKDEAKLLIYDAASLKVYFNGKFLGSLGEKGRIRRISFKSKDDLTEKLEHL